MNIDDWSGAPEMLWRGARSSPFLTMTPPRHAPSTRTFQSRRCQCDARSPRRQRPGASPRSCLRSSVLFVSDSNSAPSEARWDAVRAAPISAPKASVQLSSGVKPRCAGSLAGSAQTLLGMGAIRSGRGRRRACDQPAPPPRLLVHHPRPTLSRLPLRTWPSDSETPASLSAARVQRASEVHPRIRGWRGLCFASLRDAPIRWAAYKRSG